MKKLKVAVILGLIVYCTAVALTLTSFFPHLFEKSSGRDVMEPTHFTDVADGEYVSTEVIKIRTHYRTDGTYNAHGFFEPMFDTEPEEMLFVFDLKTSTLKRYKVADDGTLLLNGNVPLTVTPSLNEELRFDTELTIKTHWFDGLNDREGMALKKCRLAVTSKCVATYNPSDTSYDIMPVYHITPDISDVEMWRLAIGYVRGL